MTIGEKILYLRTREHLSQEALAERLDVSRQSVSKWELDESLPGLDKIIALSEAFSISCDKLLSPKTDITAENDGEHCVTRSPGKYFGTDGYRGEANKDLTSDSAYLVGRFLGWYYSRRKRSSERAKIVVGKDTRRSSYMLEYALIAGITSSGADAYMLHVTTTPGVSYVTRTDSFDVGVMITASHNPFTDNGIKIINRSGEKLEDTVTALIEAYLDGDFAPLGLSSDIPYAKGEDIGCIVDYTAGRNRYIGYLISLASHSFKGLRIGIDSANGASWSIAKAVFNALGAAVIETGCEPDGLNINKGVGSTHIENLRELVLSEGLDAGFAFDGDADRCIAVDERGDVVDGDRILYLLAKSLKEKNALDKNTVVLTVMSNQGALRALDAIGIRHELTDVGDRFVYERMQESGYSLGGEQSGHIIIKKYATTGDGLLTALMIAEEMADKKSRLSALHNDVTLYPQLQKSIRVADKDAVLSDAEVKACYESLLEELGKRGRLMLRKSGTEPVIRIMAECENEDLCQKCIMAIYDVIKRRGYANG